MISAGSAATRGPSCIRPCPVQARDDQQILSSIRHEESRMMVPTVRAALAFLLVVSAGAAEGQAPASRAVARRAPAADLIVHNARIYTADDGRPIAEALAVRAGRIVFVGSERGAMALRG